MHLFFWLWLSLIWAIFKWYIPWLRGSPWSSYPGLPQVIAFFCISSFFHRLFLPRHWVPGPVMWKTKDVPRILNILGGFYRHRLRHLHMEFGHVVAVGTNELSFNSVQAMKDIYGSWDFRKDPRLYSHSANGEFDIIGVRNRDLHTKYLRNFRPAFTDCAIQQHEALLQSQVNNFIAKLKACHQSVSDGHKAMIVVDMTDVLNLLTADIAEDLLLGTSSPSSAGLPNTCIQRGKLPEWLSSSRKHLRTPIIMIAAAEVIGLTTVERTGRFMRWFWPRAVKVIRQDFAAAIAKLGYRTRISVDREDWLTPSIRIILSEGVMGTDKSLSLEEMEANLAMLQSSGSEKTATTLAAVFFFLGTSRQARERLTNDIRKKFATDEKITLAKLSKGLPYLDAVIDESLRLYPPIPMGLPRVAKRNTMVDGVAVLAGTVVSVNPYVIARTAAHFHKPLTLHPERWLKPPPEEFAGDTLEASAPFSLGPRECLGKKFAYAELRLVIAKILFHFDFELGEGCDKWISRQRSFFSWEKLPLSVRLTERAQ